MSLGFSQIKYDQMLPEWNAQRRSWVSIKHVAVVLVKIFLTALAVQLALFKVVPKQLRWHHWHLSS